MFLRGIKNSSNIKLNNLNNVYEIIYVIYPFNNDYCRSIVLGNNELQAIEAFRNIDSLHKHADIIKIKPFYIDNGE